MSVGRVQDHQVLRKQAYADAAPLKARVDLYAHREPPLDYLAWVLGHVRLGPGLQVLDAGCGYGRALPHLAASRSWALAADLSEGMAAAVRSQIPDHAVVCADIADLPLRPASFDVVLALHVLYHVPDLDRALGEVGRVLRPGGRLLVSTTAAHHLAELRQVIARAAADVAGTTVLPAWATENFGEGFLLDEAAAHLAGAGFVIERFDVDEAHLLVREPAPAVAFVASTEHFRPPSVDWNAVVAAAGRRIEALLADVGTWEVTVATGIVVARWPG